MLPSGGQNFNYALLTEDKATGARQAAERIRGRLYTAIIETGEDLIRQKENLGHGNFLDWIEAEFGMSDRTARKFMSIARELGSNWKNSSDLSFEALAALAAPSTPEPVREEVLDRAAKGEKVTTKEIEALKRKLKKAEELATEKEAQRRAQESAANIADKQARDAANRAMFAEADKERLAEEAASLREEMERLKEDGTIHVLPAPVSAANDDAPSAPIRPPSLLLQVFDISSDDDVKELVLFRETRLSEIDGLIFQVA